MKLLGLLSAVLVTFVTLTTAKPLRSKIRSLDETTLQARNLVPFVHVKFGYWEWYEIARGSPSKAFADVSYSLTNNLCLRSDSVPHVQHITYLDVAHGDFCYFFKTNDCDVNGSYFVTGQTASLQGALKFEPRSVFCFSPNIQPGTRRSLDGAALESRSVEPQHPKPKTLASGSLEADGHPTRTLERRKPIPTLGVNMCWLDQEAPNDHLKCWEAKIANQRCYDQNWMPFLPNVRTLTVDKGDMCIFSNNSTCGVEDGQYYLANGDSPDLQGDGMHIIPESVFCFSPKVVARSLSSPESQLAENEIVERSLAIPETKNIQNRDSSTIGNIDA
ncbi:hypothetical protein FKW77_010682 [Venturia effusa]|uniref:Uncharacterized protein n=1 Tax=Venturia effusa TaxID=50376 RepID=A0A517KY60_9PEZI|nr:hypothetical protein FKW77_010682 [Venturia effusa]